MTANDKTTHKGLYEAVLAVQAAAETLPQDAVNPHFKSKYTPLDTIVEKVGPLLAHNGLVWMTFPCQDAKSQPVLRYRLTHAATGEHIEDTMPLLITQPTPQGMGSALTYARRYSLCAVLNLVADADDDGQAAKPAKAKAKAKPASDPLHGASDAQRKKIHALLTETATLRPELEQMIAPWGVELSEGWMDRLSGGRDGTASLLIDLLEERKEKQRESELPEDFR